MRGRAEIDRMGAALPPAQHVKADASRDRIQPRPQRPAGLVKPVVAVPGAQQRLLHGVFGLKRRPQHPVAVPGQLAAVPRQPRVRRRRRTSSGAACGTRLHHRRVSHPRPLPAHAPLAIHAPR